VKYVRLYGPNHRRTTAQFEVAWNELIQAIPEGKGGVVLGVSNDRLLLDGVAVETGHAERGFAQLLTASGLASIQFLNGVTRQDFEKLVRAFAFNGSRAEELANEIRTAFPNRKSNIRVNEIKFVAADPATADVTAAAQIAAQSLGPEFKEWLNDPSKLVQLIAAAEGAQGPAKTPDNAQVSMLGISESPASWAELPFLLNDKETIQALKLLTRFGELGAHPTPKPELIGVELHHSDEKIKSSVLSLLDELSKLPATQKIDKPILMRAAEQMAIRYALERFESGDVKVNAVRELLEQMSHQMAGLRNILKLQEEKLTHAGLLVESHADILDRKFWAELPESNKKKALLSEDAPCVPARNVRQYVELLLKRSDREMASEILRNYAGAVTSKDVDYRLRVATGLTQLADLYAIVGGTVLGETTQTLGDAIAKESDPEIEPLLGAAFGQDPYGAQGFQLPIVVQMELAAGGESIVATKRVIFSQKIPDRDPTPNQNPVPSSVTVYPVRDAQANPVAPTDLAEDETVGVPLGGQLWFETNDTPAEAYSTRTLTRDVPPQVVTTDVEAETLRFAFFATAGSFSPPETTTIRSVLLNQDRVHLESQYNAPGVAPADANVTIWIVAHDERGGTSFTRRHVMVGAP